MGFFLPTSLPLQLGLNGHFKQEDYDYELGQELTLSGDHLEVVCYILGRSRVEAF